MTGGEDEDDEDSSSSEDEDIRRHPKKVGDCLCIATKEPDLSLDTPGVLSSGMRLC